MLTGRPPFKGETPIETVRQVIDDEVGAPLPARPQGRPRPGDHLPEVPEQGAVAGGTTRPGPWPRTSSAPRRRDDPGPAHPAPGARGQVGPPPAGRRRPVGLGLAVFLALIVGGAVSYEHAGRSEPRPARAGAASDTPARDRRDRRSSTIRRGRRAPAAIELLQSSVDKTADRRHLAVELSRRRWTGSSGPWGQAVARNSQARGSSRSDPADREQFQGSVDLRSQAQLHAAGFELEPADRLRSSAMPAAAALAVYARDPRRPTRSGPWRPPLPDVLSDAEKAQVAEGCYDLLLLLSQAVDPAAGLKSSIGRRSCARSRPRPITSAAPTAWPGRRRRRPDSARKSWPASGRRSPRWTTS